MKLYIENSNGETLVEKLIPWSRSVTFTDVRELYTEVLDFDLKYHKEKKPRGYYSLKLDSTEVVFVDVYWYYRGLKLDVPFSYSTSSYSRPSSCTFSQYGRRFLCSFFHDGTACSVVLTD